MFLLCGLLNSIEEGKNIDYSFHSNISRNLNSDAFQIRTFLFVTKTMKFELYRIFQLFG